ncbi:MAG: hypothetical protein BWY63_01743 [Chloroflexi bacterium ADurb.Bin360]|nr:MAG: hypothetical protein BWY63_01743 [Chloroflexi bacterium ADurb.Bin360]
MGDVENRMAGSAIRRTEETGNIQRLPLEPALEGGRSDDVVERHRQAKTVLLREEGIHIKDPELANRWVLNRKDNFGQVQILTVTPVMFEDVGEQNVFPRANGVGINAHQSQQSAHRPLNAFAQQFCIGIPAERWGIEGMHDRDGDACIAAGRVDDEVRRITQHADTLPVLSPIRQALAPLRRLRTRKLLDTQTLASCIIHVHPGLEIFRQQVRESQEQVGDIPLGINE